MCDVMKKYKDAARAEGEAKARDLFRQRMILAGIPAEQIEAVLA